MCQGQPRYPPNLQLQHGYYAWPPFEPPKPEEPKKPEPTPLNTVIANFLVGVGAIPPPPPPPAQEAPPKPPMQQFACYPLALPPPPPPQNAVACPPPGAPYGCPPWAMYQPLPPAPEKPKPKPRKPPAQMQSRTAMQYQFRHGRAGGDLKASEEQWGYGQMQWNQMGQMDMWEIAEEDPPAEEEPKPGFYFDGNGWWYQS